MKLINSRPTLVHTLRRELQDQDALAYFYIDGTNEQLSDPAIIWGSILRQPLRRSTIYILVEKKWNENARPPIDSCLVSASLREAITTQPSRGTTYILTDAIDEARNVHDLLVGFHAISQPCGARVLVLFSDRLGSLVRIRR
jgi:hypothetical protein